MKKNQKIFQNEKNHIIRAIAESRLLLGEIKNGILLQKNGKKEDVSELVATFEQQMEWLLKGFNFMFFFINTIFHSKKDKWRLFVKRTE